MYKYLLIILVMFSCNQILAQDTLADSNEKKSKAINKIKEFQRLFQCMTNDSLPQNMQASCESSFLDYFSEGAKIEVSNKYKPKEIREYTPEKYTTHTRFLKDRYDLIKINFLKPEIEKFEQIDINKFKLVGEMKQIFQGYISHKEVYSDITIKYITISMEEDYDEDYNVWLTRIKFDYIKVEYTESLENFFKKN